MLGMKRSLAPLLLVALAMLTTTALHCRRKASTYAQLQERFENTATTKARTAHNDYVDSFEKLLGPN